MSEFPKITFGLNENQVPEPSESNQWVDTLRWLICVMDNDDTSLGFIAGIFAHALKNEGYLTEKQSKIGNKIYRRVHRAYMEEILECQNTSDPSLQSEFSAEDKLLHMKAKGEA